MNTNRVIIGTWPLSGDFGHVGLREVEDALEACWDSGFREYDTAPNYGSGFMEYCLAKTLSRRDGFLLNTKCGNIPFGGKSFAVDALRRSVEQSLKRAGAECINILYLHNPRTEIDDYEPVIELMEQLKDEGKIRHAGISLAKGYKYPEAVLSSFEAIQDDVNLLYLEPVLRTYADNSILIARSPLASGLLGGRITSATIFGSGDQRGSWMKDARLKSIVKRVDVLRKEFDMPISQLARRYLLSHPRVHRVIFGVKRPGHVHDLRADLELPCLSQFEMDRIMELYQSDFGLVNERHLSY